MKTCTIYDCNSMNHKQDNFRLKYRGKDLCVSITPYQTNPEHAALAEAKRLGFTHAKMPLVFELHGNYGYGWDCEYTENSLRDLKARLKEYQENGGGSYKTKVYNPVINLSTIE